MDESQALSADPQQPDVFRHGSYNVARATNRKNSYETRQFPGQVAHAWFGELQFIELRVLVASSLYPAQVEAAGMCNPSFSLLVQLDGASLVCQDGREARLSSGDFTLCNDRRPYEMHCGGASRVLCLRLPEHLLRRHVANAHQLVAVPVSSVVRSAALLPVFINQLWERCFETLDSSAMAHVTQAALSLIAGAYAAMPAAWRGRRSTAAARRERIRNYVEEHLTDNDLTPESIAVACDIKSRYLRKLYESEHETLTQYILRRRLEECAGELRTCSQANRNVTDIAFSYGFNSVTHFGRVFRERYAVTPSAYRARYRR